METESEWPPVPPEGYRKHDPEYGQPWYVTAFLYIWIVGVFVGVLALVSGSTAPIPLFASFGKSYSRTPPASGRGILNG